MNSSISVSQTQSEMFIPGTHALLAYWYHSIVARLLCTTARESDYLVYTHTSGIAENRTVLCGLTLVMIFILHFRPLWRCGWATGWYCSLWSTRLSNVLSRLNSFHLLYIYICMSIYMYIYMYIYISVIAWVWFLWSHPQTTRHVVLIRPGSRI